MLWLLVGIGVVALLARSSGTGAGGSGISTSPYQAPVVSGGASTSGGNAFVGAGASAAGSVTTKTYPSNLNMAQTILGDPAAREATSREKTASFLGGQLGLFFTVVDSAQQVHGWNTEAALKADYDAVIGR